MSSSIRYNFSNKLAFEEKFKIYLYNNCDITFFSVFMLIHPVNFPRGRKPEHPEKTHDFRQSVDRLYSHESAHESVARIESTITEVEGACSDDC